jgi:hypothetical protein
MKVLTSLIFDEIAVRIVNIKIVLILGMLLLVGCLPKCKRFEPMICYTPSLWHPAMLPSPFPPLTEKELDQSFGQELMIARKFAREGDYYRAITSFKRAAFLIPKQEKQRRLEIDYGIILCYYMGQKYSEVLLTFEGSDLSSVTSDFPTFGDLIMILQDSYTQCGQEQKGAMLLELMEKGDPERAEKLKASHALTNGDLQQALGHVPECDELHHFANRFCHCYKSARKAQVLNAILPGAGYYYVGQKKSALTSFVINTLFIAAAYHFFDHGNWGAGLITTSLEAGWYIGGINGAGIAAVEFNERTYERHVKEIMEKQHIFPVLMLEASF